MTYFDGQHWSSCRRCGRICVVVFLPDRLGDLVPICSGCCEKSRELLARGNSVVKLPKRDGAVDYGHLLEWDDE